MPINESVEIKKIHVCEHCGKTTEEVPIEEWYTFYVSAKSKVLLCQGLNANSYFEEYGLPKSLIETYCSLECARTKMTKDIDLFLASIKNRRRSAKSKPLQ